MKKINLFFAIAFCSASVTAQPVGSDSLQAKKQSSIIADNAVIQLISGQFSFTEGPAADKAGNVFFTDQPNDRIWQYGTDGNLSLFMEKTGRSNGLYFDSKDQLVACADEQNQLWRFGPGKKITVLLKDFNGLHFNGPNDLWIDRHDDIYFTDPYYKRDYWTRKEPEIKEQKVYFLAKDKAPIVVADDLVQPNGIIGTADGKYLYVADIGAGKTYRYVIAPDHSLTEKTLFAELGSDGMTIDEQGNVYLTGKGVTVYNNKGKLIEHIDIPVNWTANVTFGGKDRDLLFITASKCVYTLKMKVKGARRAE